jgi:hypothetical protein
MHKIEYDPLLKEMCYFLLSILTVYSSVYGEKNNTKNNHYCNEVMNVMLTLSYETPISCYQYGTPTGKSIISYHTVPNTTCHFSTASMLK